MQLRENNGAEVRSADAINTSERTSDVEDASWHAMFARTRSCVSQQTDTQVHLDPVPLDSISTPETLALSTDLTQLLHQISSDGPTTRPPSPSIA